MPEIRHVRGRILNTVKLCEVGQGGRAGTSTYSYSAARFERSVPARRFAFDTVFMVNERFTTR
jgi:hypothetical protein